MDVEILSGTREADWPDAVARLLHEHPERFGVEASVHRQGIGRLLVRSVE